MYSAGDTRALPRVGFPIRRSRDQRLVSTSPGLIAAAHVLHRLSAPRHPPCALVLLIEKNTCVCRYGVVKVRASSHPPSKRHGPKGPSLKTQQRELVVPPEATAGEACVVTGPESRSTYSRRDRTPDDPRIIDGPAAPSG